MKTIQPMKAFTAVMLLLTFFGAFAQESVKVDDQILKEMKFQATTQLIDKWYPLVVDDKDGGYYSAITFDFKVGTDQNKMIVTQARHLWATSNAALLYKDSSFLAHAIHAFEFLTSKMWDSKPGGFYDLVDKKGTPIQN